MDKICHCAGFYLEVSVWIPGMEASSLRGVTRLLWWSTEAWDWESLDTQRKPALIWNMMKHGYFFSHSYVVLYENFRDNHSFKLY